MKTLTTILKKVFMTIEMVMYVLIGISFGIVVGLLIAGFVYVKALNEMTKEITND
jgi:ABC-type antimicrobial peptide transport system permease subunit